MYRKDGLVYMTIQDRAWGKIKVARILPIGDDNWGAFSDLKDTPWASMVNEVGADILDMALRKHPTPLMKIIGRDPKGNLKMIPLEQGCSLIGQCKSEKPICSKIETAPFCVAPKTDSTSVHSLLSAWREGYYVIRIWSPS